MRVRARSHSAGSPAYLPGTCLSTCERNGSLLPDLVAVSQESSLDRSHPSAVGVGDSLVESLGISNHDSEDGIVEAGHPPSGASCVGRAHASSAATADGIMAAGPPLSVASFAGRAHTSSAATAGDGTRSRLLEVIESVFVSLSSCVHNSSPSSLRVSSHTRAHEICLAAALACHQEVSKWAVSKQTWYYNTEEVSHQPIKQQQTYQDNQTRPKACPKNQQKKTHAAWK